MLPSLDDTVTKLKSEAGELRNKISELEAGVIKQYDLKAELDESRGELDQLKEQVEKMSGDAAEKAAPDRKCAQLEV